METVLKFSLDATNGVPFYKQIILQVEMAIADGRLNTGDQLPTVRGLAVELQVNPNTVRKAYSELEILGILDTQQGTGTFVSDQQVEIGEAEKQRMLGQICDELVARGHQYGFTLKEIVTHLNRRLENGQNTKNQ